MLKRFRSLVNKILTSGRIAKVPPPVSSLLSNMGWLAGEKIVRMIAGLAVAALLARYLGPEDFGALNFAIAFVGIFGVFASLGLNGIVVRELVNHPKEANSILGTAAVMQFVGGVLAAVGAIISISILRPDEEKVKTLVAISSSILLFKLFELVRAWFEAKVNSQGVAKIDGVSMLFFLVVKVVLIIGKAPLIWFAWAAVLELFFAAFGLSILYSNSVGSLKYLKVEFRRFKILLKDGWPLIFSGLAMIVYMRIDQLMLGKMIGDNAVGVFTAATRLTEAWYFIPIIVVASIFPKIQAHAFSNIEHYNKNLQKLFNFAFLFSVFLVVPTVFLSKEIILILYGKEYGESSYVLRVHILSNVFVFFGVIVGRCLLIHNKQRIIVARTVCGCVLNVGLNLIFIPSHGEVGAAWSTVISQAAVGFLFNVLTPDTRGIFCMQCKSFIFPIEFVKQRFFQKK